MKVNFEELKELDVPNMNGGTGIVKAKMFMNKDYKIIKSVLAPNTSMGKHTQKNNEFMYVISGEAKIIIDGVEEIIKKLLAEYDVSEEECEKSVMEFLGKLKEYDFL